MPCATLTESGGELLSCVCVVVQQWLAADVAVFLEYIYVSVDVRREKACTIIFQIDVFLSSLKDRF